MKSEKFREIVVLKNPAALAEEAARRFVQLAGAAIEAICAFHSQGSSLRRTLGCRV